MSPNEARPQNLLIVGAGELGREICLSAKELGFHVVAIDRYPNAPAMGVCDVAEVVDLLDGEALEKAIRKHAPDLVFPELETIRSERLVSLAREGVTVVPTAESLQLASSREGMRALAAQELELPTAAYGFAGSEAELRTVAGRIGYPCVVKPVLSFSGRGQSIVGGVARLDRAWAFAQEEGPGDVSRVIVEELVEFDEEITLVAVRHPGGAVRFLPPIGHRQEGGDFRESWIPAGVPEAALDQAHSFARRLVERLGGAGVYGIEFFVVGDEVIFSEISPGPHDTAMVTLISHDLSQFELHVRAALGFPVPRLHDHGPSASAVILGRKEGEVKGYRGIARALEVPSARVRIFGKQTARRDRRMGLALAAGATVEEARVRALEAASRVDVEVH